MERIQVGLGFACTEGILIVHIMKIHDCYSIYLELYAHEKKSYMDDKV